ncbi:MAG: amidophosphoribosyltransferase [Proteobacteria bacterium]|nr:amidophosphoribosyltransferase [Pseudomonadota bacterium]
MCGIVGIYNVPEASKIAALGIHGLQHRGQEGAGIISYDKEFHIHGDYGRVDHIFSSDKVIKNLPGNTAIGHVRYSTTGGTGKSNVQPLFYNLDFGGFAIAHNGDFTDSAYWREKLTKEGAIFQTTTDTEIIPHLIARTKGIDPVDRLLTVLNKVNGAFSIIALMDNKLVVARDPYGFRPLVIGRYEEGYAIASETCALDLIGATNIVDVQPGEVIIFDNEKKETFYLDKKVTKHFCIFEHIYFSRPDSVIDNQLVYEVRKRIGEELAKESYVESDMIVPVPDSGMASALGYANQSKIPFELGLTRSHYKGRTFIEPTQKIRDLGVRLKHSAMRLFKDKTVTVIDDSIVRGTTSKKIIKMIRKAGAKKIHMRISSPPVTGPCHYGIDTPNRKELIAGESNVKEIEEFIGADSLEYISIEGLHKAMKSKGYCDACFTGNYPVKKQLATNS